MSGQPPSRRPLSVGAVLRFVGSVLVVSGALLLVDVAITVIWQEPVSAFMAARQQDALDEDFRAQVRTYASSVPSPEPGTADPEAAATPRAAGAARAYASRLQRGRAVARITLPTLGDSFIVAEGTDPATLRKGPGHYASSGLPGLRRTVAIAGHRTTYGAPFADLDDLQRGARIDVEMPYGRFTYRVRERRIVAPDAVWVTERGSHRLVLTTCHPPFSAAERLVVVADLVRDGR